MQQVVEERASQANQKKLSHPMSGQHLALGHETENQA
jgi:hypothetical protein